MGSVISSIAGTLKTSGKTAKGIASASNKSSKLTPNLNSEDSSLEPQEENPTQLASLVNPEDSQSSNPFSEESENVLNDVVSKENENPAVSGETDPSFDVSEGTLLAQANQNEFSEEDLDSSGPENLPLEDGDSNFQFADPTVKKGEGFHNIIGRLYPAYTAAGEAEKKKELEKIKRLLKKRGLSHNPNLVLKMEEVTGFSANSIFNGWDFVKNKYEEIETERLLKSDKVKEFFEDFKDQENFKFEDLQEFSLFDSFFKKTSDAHTVSISNYKKADIGGAIYNKGTVSAAEIEEILEYDKNILAHQHSDGISDLLLGGLVDWANLINRSKEEAGIAYLATLGATSVTGPASPVVASQAALTTLAVSTFMDSVITQRNLMVADLAKQKIDVKVASRIADGVAVLIGSLEFGPGKVFSKMKNKALKVHVVKRLTHYLKSSKGRKVLKILQQPLDELLTGTGKAGLAQAFNELGMHSAEIFGRNEEGEEAKFPSQKNLVQSMQNIFKAMENSFKTGTVKQVFNIKMTQLKDRLRKKKHSESITDSESVTVTEKLKESNTHNFQVELRKLINNSNLLKKHPDQIKKMIQDYGEENGIETVYITADKFKKYLGNHKAARETLETVLPDLASNLDSIESGTTVEMPIGDYVTYFLAEGKLIKDTRFHPGKNSAKSVNPPDIDNSDLKLEQQESKLFFPRFKKAKKLKRKLGPLQKPDTNKYTQESFKNLLDDLNTLNKKMGEPELSQEKLSKDVNTSVNAVKYKDRNSNQFKEIENQSANQIKKTLKKAKESGLDLKNRKDLAFHKKQRAIHYLRVILLQEKRMEAEKAVKFLQSISIKQLQNSLDPKTQKDVMGALEAHGFLQENSLQDGPANRKPKPYEEASLEELINLFIIVEDLLKTGKKDKNHNPAGTVTLEIESEKNGKPRLKK